MADKHLEALKSFAEERAAHAVNSAYGNRSDPAIALASALESIAESWRTEATYWIEAKKKGSIGTAAELRSAAARLAAIAVDIRSGPFSAPTDDRVGSGVAVIELEPPAPPAFAEPCGSLPLGSDLAAPCIRERGHSSSCVGIDGSRWPHPGPSDVGIDRIGEPVHLDRLRDHREATLDQRLDEAFGPIPPGNHVTTHTLSTGGQVTVVTGPLVQPELPMFMEPGHAPADPSSAPAMLIEVSEPEPHPGTGWPLTWGELIEPVALGLHPQHRSYSQLTQYAECGFRYRLSRYHGDRVPARPQWATLGGSAVHAFVAWFEGAAAVMSDWRAAAKALTAERVVQLWAESFDAQIEGARSSTWPLEQWRASNKGKEGYDWWRIEGAEMCSRYVAWRLASTRPSPFLVEHPFSIELLGVPVAGVIDQAYQDSGVITVTDVKTGARPQPDRAQLGLYAVALDATYVPPGEFATYAGGYLDLRKGEEIQTGPIDLDAARAELGARLSVMHRAELAGIYMPNPSSFCGSCAVSAGCPARQL